MNPKRLFFLFLVVLFSLGCFLIGCAQNNHSAKIENKTENALSQSQNTPDNELVAKSQKKKNKKSKKQNVQKNSGEKQSGAVSGVSRIRLATWNLHDFFDTVDDPNNDEVLTPKEYQEKITNLAKVLQAVNADVVGVQEVEKLHSLEELAARSGYKYAVLVEGNDVMRGIDVGVLSKIPIKNYVSHSKDACIAPNGRRGGFSRDCLEVHFDHPTKFTLLVNHFKSQGGKDKKGNDAKRIGQSNRVKEIAASLSKYPLAIVGDLNADPDSPSLTPLLTATFLTNVLDSVPKGQCYTFMNRRYKSALDYIIVNQRLSPCIMPGSVKIEISKDVAAASDHRPVYVDIDFTKMVK